MYSLLSLYSTAPQNQQRRPVMDLAAIPSMPANPHFSRNTPARSTYAYGSRRPAPPFAQQYNPTGVGASGAVQPGGPGSGFFKRLIPVRFSSKRTRYVQYNNKLHTVLYIHSTIHASNNTIRLY